MPKTTRQMVRYLETYFDAGLPKYQAGEYYPLTEETDRHVAGGLAEMKEIEVEDDTVEQLVAKARVASEAAAAAAAEADRLAADAKAAQKLVDDAHAATDAANTAPSADPANDSAATSAEVSTKAVEGKKNAKTAQELPVEVRAEAPETLAQ